MHELDLILMVIGNDENCYRIEVGNKCDRRDGDGDGSHRHSYKIEVVLHVINVMAMVIDIVKGLKL